MRRDFSLYAAGILTGCSLFVAFGATSGPAETVRARSFILEDSTGAVVGTWDSNDLGQRFVNGPDEAAQVVLFAGDDGGTEQAGSARALTFVTATAPGMSSASMRASTTSTVSVNVPDGPRGTLYSGDSPRDRRGHLRLFDEATRDVTTELP